MSHDSEYSKSNTDALPALASHPVETSRSYEGVVDLESCLQLVFGAGFVGKGFVSAKDSDSNSCEVVPKKSKMVGTGKKPRPQRTTFAPTAAGTVHTESTHKIVERVDNGSADTCGMHSAGSLTCLAYIQWVSRCFQFQQTIPGGC